MISLFDAHTHLNDDKLIVDTDYYVEHAHELHVDKMAIVGSNADFNRKAIEIAQKYDGLYSVIGYHPDDSKDFNEDTKQELIEQLDQDKVVAVGEIGLDYYWDASPRKTQWTVFEEQLEIARQKNLPVSIHTRDAMEDTYAILKNAHIDQIGGVLHSFNQGPAWLERLLELGMNISYSGVVSFKNAKEVHASAIETPLDRLMVETDAPYLTPMPYRGKQNEPGYTFYVAQAIADLKGRSIDEIASATYQNTMNFYGIK